MAYVALYRKWRPQDFESVIGQPHIVRTLKNAIEKNKVAHAYLFSGPRGTGKTSTAKILAKALNCKHGPTIHPCGECETCRKITEGSSMDVLEIDAASNRGIDEIRSLRETVGFLPVDGRYKVYIIDEVHMLTTEAFNALLKTLEEPPPHILFILATTEPHKIPATIHSRCQRYDFRRISAADIEARLTNIINKMDLSVEQDALKIIADAAEGGMRDALSLLDQCLTTSNSAVTAEDVENLLGIVGHTWVAKLADNIAAHDSRQTLLTFSDLLAEGKDPRQMLIELAEHMRNVLLYGIAPDTADNLTDPAALKRQAQAIGAEDLSCMIRRLYEGAQESKYSSDIRITAEVALLDLCARQYGASDIDKLTARIADLEDRLAQSNFAPSTATGTPSPHAQAPQMSPPPRQTTVDSPSTAQIPPAQKTGAPTPKENSAPQAKPATVTTYRAPMPPSRAPKVPAPPTARATPPSASQTENSDIWKRVLDALIESGKRSAYACVNQGRLKEIKENTVTIAFERAFVRERTEKDDYRTMMEDIFARILGRNVRLICIQESAPAAPPPNPYAKYPRAVQEGIKMFGDNITIIKE